MEKFVTSLAIVIALASAFVWGWFAGARHTEKAAVSKMETTTTDTVWTEVHDTCWREVAVNFLRTDTVRLARVVRAENAHTTLANVHENGKTGTLADRHVPESEETGTYTDTLIVRDSVFVEVPIEQKTFVGDNWRVTAHGYRVGLDEVWVNRPTVYVTKTQAKTKRWAFSVGAQMGYGYTVHGASPYIGIGAGFGYTF